MKDVASLWNSDAANAYGIIRFVCNPSPTKAYGVSNILTNYFATASSIVTSQDSVEGISGYSNNYIYCCVLASHLSGDLTTQAGRSAAFINWLTDNNIKIIYELATPTTLSASPYTNPQETAVGGTEEFVDYLVEQGTRDVAIPVGHQTEYGMRYTIDNIVTDASGYGYDGSIYGNTLLSLSDDTPRYSKCVYIPSESCIQHDKALSNTDQEWTCCAWIKLDSDTSYQDLNNFNIANRIRHGTYPLLYLNSGNNDYYRYGNIAITKNTWTHIAFVFKNSTGLMNIYINGVLTNGSWVNKTSTPTGIPDTINVAFNGFSGYLSDYREYSTALSADDIKSLYETSMSIDKTNKIFTYEINEVDSDKNISIKKNGQLITDTLQEQNGTVSFEKTGTVNTFECIEI
jgi:hypothetical protein